MALQTWETWRRGFIIEKTTGAIVITPNVTGAADRGGFLRDADGRLVVKHA